MPRATEDERIMEQRSESAQRILNHLERAWECLQGAESLMSDKFQEEFDASEEVSRAINEAIDAVKGLL